MLKSTLVALGTVATLSSIAQNTQALTHQSELLLTPQSHPHLQAQVIMNNNKPADDNNNPPPANNPPPKKDPPHPGFDPAPLPIDRPGFPAGGTPDVPPGLPPGFRPNSSVIFTNFYYHNDRWTTSPNSKPWKACGKGYRVVQGTLCQRVKK